MNRFFQPDNPIMRFLSKFCDLMFLNSLFLLSCIPIITIGTAISALYYMVLKMHNDEEPSIAKGYFKAFRGKFRQVTLIWIPLLFLFFFFGTDLYIIYHVIDPKYNWLQVPVWIILFILVSILIYAFPLLSSFESSVGQLLKNSVLLSISNIPTTIFIIVIQIVIIYLCLISGELMVVIGSLALFFGCAAMAYFYALFLGRIFAKCMENSQNTKEKDKAAD